MLNRWGRKADGRSRRATGLLSRLAGDIRGNTLAIVGAAMIPLTAMIGSGVDMSRAYMAKHRLQSACDAAALAGRRVMQNDAVDQKVIDEATRFFNFNFKQGLYSTDAFTPQVTRSAAGTVRVTANTGIPTAIMSIFGWKKIALDVTCDASQNFVNTDVMLVLDVTGSMNRDVNDDATNVVADRKITALREAVLALYDQLAPIQTQLQAAGMRLRYGVVPYSTTVNVGSLIRAKSSAYLADSWTYPSRTAIYATSEAPVRVGNSLTNSQCNNYYSARTPSNSYPSVEYVVARPGSGTYRPCDRTKITYTEGTGANFAWWIHEPNVYDTSQFKLGGANVLLPTRAAGTSTKATAWNGCIEERDTVDTITANSGYDIPSGASDLDIDLVPNSAETKWRPQWLQVLYDPTSSNLTTAQSDARNFANTASADEKACPTLAKALAPWTKSDLSDYLDTLTPQGFTYHDIGMIWGARMISSDGIFGNDNPETYNSMPVSKHIIFMTDGIMKPQSSSYNAYGIEDIDHRIGGTGITQSALTDRHNQRFKMVCNAIRGKKVTIWVVAFGVTATPELADCAGVKLPSPQVATITNKQALIDKFKEIGKNIGSLRLTK